MNVSLEVGFESPDGEHGKQHPILRLRDEMLYRQPRGPKVGINAYHNLVSADVSIYTAHDARELAQHLQAARDELVAWAESQEKVTS